MIFSNISILVPFNTDNSSRDRNWKWIQERYKLLMPDAEICIGTSDKTQYCRCQAINNAAKIATRDIFIITDADLIFDIEDIKRALDLLPAHKWIIPYSKLIKFNESLTNSILSNPHDIHLSSIPLNNINSELYFDSTLPNAYQLVGGIQIIERSSFLQCGGFDERFIGWGREDDAFAHIAKFLFKKITRVDNMTVYHLYHERQTPDKKSLDRNTAIFNTYYRNCKNLTDTINYLKLENKFL